MSIDNALRESHRSHPAYESHEIIKSTDDLVVARVTYSERHEDYTGGTFIHIYNIESLLFDPSCEPLEEVPVGESDCECLWDGWPDKLIECWECELERGNFLG